MTVVGDNGRDYPFLLKGHEDLRQDERLEFTQAQN